MVFWVTFLGASTVQLFVYTITFRRFAFFRPKSESVSRQPVSVIICARNESDNIRNNLSLWANQDYPDYELILVNDCSWDDTGEVLKELAPQFPRVKVVTIQEQERYSHGKKFALTLGVKAASHEWMLFTDADCRPASPQWITQMQSHFVKEKEIVLGYGAYERRKGLLNRWIRFDTAFIAMQYFSFALGNNAYMGVGRNLAYRKTLFFRNKGFAKHNHLPSGDDDLLVNETATADNVTLCFHPDAFTFSVPKTSFGAWFRQKTRHLTTSRLYKSRHRFALAMYHITLLLLFVSMAGLLAFRFLWKETLAVYGGLLLLKYLIFGRSAARLKEKDLIVLFPIFECLSAFLQPLVFIAQLFTKKRSWR